MVQRLHTCSRCDLHCLPCRAHLGGLVPLSAGNLLLPWAACSVLFAWLHTAIPPGPHWPSAAAPQQYMLWAHISR